MIEIDNLVNDLDKILSNIVDVASVNTIPVAKNSKEIIIGRCIIKKQSNTFCVVSGSINYPELFLIESAFVIARALQAGMDDRIKHIIELENAYSKSYMDMIFFANSYISAKKDRDYVKMEIVENRYVISKAMADGAKARIRKLDNAFQKKDKY